MLRVGDCMKIFNKEISKRELISKIIFFVSFVVFIYSLYMIIDYFYDSIKNKQIYSDLYNKVEEALQHDQKVFYDDTFDHLLQQIVLNDKSPGKDKVNKSQMLPHVRLAYEENKDTVGWIVVPGIDQIDYPVVQAEDNDYYLDIAFDGSQRRAGSIFMDYRNKGDGTDKHTIIYGHNMRDNSMFGLLDRYKDKSYYEKNRIIKFDTLYEELEWEIFSVYVTGIEFNYIKTRFETPGEYESFIKSITERHMHKNSEKNIDVTKDDQILTLSTCTYEYGDARFVIHAKLINGRDNDDNEKAAEIDDKDSKDTDTKDKEVKDKDAQDGNEG